MHTNSLYFETTCPNRHPTFKRRPIQFTHTQHISGSNAPLYTVSAVMRLCFGAASVAASVPVCCTTLAPPLATDRCELSVYVFLWLGVCGSAYGLYADCCCCRRCFVYNVSHTTFLCVSAILAGIANVRLLWLWLMVLVRNVGHKCHVLFNKFG